MTSACLSTSLIICTCSLERWHDLLEAVASARNLSPAPDEIVIVVDHNPELRSRCEVEFSDLVVAENKQARGLSGARNSGIAVAHGSLVIFLDDDAIADPRWLACIRVHCEQPGVLGAMGRIEPIWLGARPRWFPDEFLWVVGCTYRGFPERTGYIRNLLGCSMALRREVLEKVGGFNARLGRTESAFAWSCEETELCQRARALNPSSEFVFEPATSVRHKVPARRLTPKYFAMRCFAEGRSKWQVASLASSGNALSTEWTYVLKTLPRGVARGFGDTLLRLDTGGLGRALAIVAGLACAVAGFAIGKLGAILGRDRFVSELKGQTR